ncbi:MAG: hypothetical protein HWQ38_01730 [Nostoc sp. NMS7]|uniref:CVNH domain-containing protein n=1 Tax=Nostoc sp. NMS7 TaxID=2815391 RepID=UPI0025F43D6B|nr:CVNH domain-containing protein [Nostoc sp. NMS7]MBN3945265.1 hypothetical protein [Nostoc sp. NMS7]
MFKFTKYIFILSLVVTLILFKQNAALAGGGFTASCLNITVSLVIGNLQGERHGGLILQAYCYSRTGQLKISAIDLGKSIANNDGALVWYNGGNFASSVTNCAVNVSTFTILSCGAVRRDGSIVIASINLDEEIANLDGNLTALVGF